MQKFTRNQVLVIVDEDLINMEEFGDSNFKPFIAKRDGSFEIRETYFYTGGKTAEKWTARVVKFFEAKGYSIEIVEAGNHYGNWPRESYFWVRFNNIGVAEETTAKQG